MMRLDPTDEDLGLDPWAQEDDVAAPFRRADQRLRWRRVDEVKIYDDTADNDD